MSSPESGGGPLPSDLDDIDEDSAAKVRQFLEMVVRSGDGANTSTSTPTQEQPLRRVDHDRQVMRFAWACEELNVAFAEIDSNDELTLDMLVEHGVGLTLREVEHKAAALASAIESADLTRHG